MFRGALCGPPLLAVVLLATGGVHRASSLRLVELAHVNPGGSSADVWGHRGYAYLSSARGRHCPSRGVRVYDLRNPRRPRRISTFAAGRSRPRLVDTRTEKTIVRHIATSQFTGELAATGIQRCHAHESQEFQGFGLYDVTRPRRPKQLALVPLEPGGSHEIWLQPKGKRAYVYTAILRSELLSAKRGKPGRPDFRIFDVTDPQRPVEVGGWGAWRRLGIRPFEGTRDRYVHSVITNAAATRAFLSYWDLGTVILDISNPARPRYLGRTHDPQGSAHSAALAAGEKILVETHERPDGWATLFDVSRPRRPRRLGVAAFPGLPGTPGTFTTGVHDPKVRGDRLYLSWFRRGVVVADISEPRSPGVLAEFVPPPERDVTGALLCSPQRRCPLVWGVYPEKNYVLASDMNSGLWVLQLRSHQ